MSELTRGLTREEIIMIALSDKMAWGHKPLDITRLTDVSTTDTKDALGWTPVSTMLKSSGMVLVFGANAPTPDRFKKVLTTRPTAGQQGSVSAYGSPLARYNDKRRTRNWQLIKEGRSASPTANAARETVGVELSNGGIYLIRVDVADANNYATELGLIRASGLNTADERKRCFTGTQRTQPAKVRRQLGNGTLTMPCKADKLEAAILTKGWVKVHGELLDLRVTGATPSGGGSGEGG